MVFKKEVLFFTLILVFALAISLFAFSTFYINPFDLTIRLFALNGYIALSIAAIMTPLLKEITLYFHKSFTKVHHYFAAAGLTLITLHPIALTIQTLNPALLLPNVESLYVFLLYGGSVALILVYVAFVSALLRRKINSHWRLFHALMYVALFFGIVHANLWNYDLQSIYLKVVYDGLFAATLVAFGLKRWQFYQLKARMKANSENKRNGLK